MGQYLQNQYTADVRPIRIKPSTPAALTKFIELGRTGEGDARFYATLKLAVKQPTLEYPTTKITIQLGNGKSTTFNRVTVDELRSVVTTISAFIDEAIPIIDRLKPLECSMKQQREAALYEQSHYYEPEQQSAVSYPQQNGNVPGSNGNEMDLVSLAKAVKELM